MTTTHPSAQASTIASAQTHTTPHRVNDRVQVHRRGSRQPGRISSVHHHTDGVEYVVRLDGPDGGPGEVVNVWTTSGQSNFLTRDGGEQR